MSEDKLPRIALMLSGMPRQWRQSLHSQLELLRDYPVDVFFHFWDVIGAAEKDEILYLLKPRAYCFDPVKDFSSFDTDPDITPDLINVPSRTFSQYYSWRSVGQLVEPFKADYAYGMRSRADLQFVYNIHHIIPQLKPNDILIPWWEEKYLLSDLFALGGIEPILYFHTLYDHARDYAKGRQFNAELMLTTHFENRPDFHIYTETFRYFFVRRPHMEHYTVEEAMRENPGRNKWLDPEIVEAHETFHSQQRGDQGAQYVQNFRDNQLRIMACELPQKKK